MRAWGAVLLALGATGCASAVAGPAWRPNPYADYVIGAYAERSRDPQTASARLNAALTRAPDDAELLRSAADAALQSGDVARAAALGRRAQRQGVSTASGALALAATSLARSPGRAHQTLQDIDGAPVELMTGRLMDAWALAGLGRTDDGLALLGDDLAAPRSPWDSLRHNTRAAILHLAGRNEEALTAYAAADRGGMRVAQIALERGALLVSMGRGDEAKAIWRALLSDVDNPALAEALGRLERGDPLDAPRPAAARGAALSLFSLALLVGGGSGGAEGATPLALAIALDPDFDAARISYAESLRAMDRIAESRAVLGKVPRSSPLFESAQAMIAYAYAAEGNDTEAVTRARAVAETSGGRIARRTLADMLRNTERYDEAAPLYEALTAELAAPVGRDWRLFFAKGATLERLGRWPEAEAAFKRALDLSPDQPEVLNYLGYFWVDSATNVAGGLDILKRAAAQRPDAGYIIDSLGWAYFRLGDFAAAVEHLERAVELEPGDVTINDHLGDAYWRNGQRIEALYQWRRILTLEPKPAERAAAERKITEGLPPAP